MELDLSLSGHSWRALAEEPSIPVVVVPDSSNVWDIDSVIVERDNGDGTIDVGSNLVALAP